MTNVNADKQTVSVDRIFDAPRDLVFQAYTDPKHIPHWWGPRNLTTIVDKLEAKVGGTWRFLNRDKDGNEFGFHGVYHEVTASERIVSTFEFEGLPGNVLLEAIIFEALPDGRTRIIGKGTSIFTSDEARDQMMNTGMEEGAKETWDRFAELLATLQTT